MRPCPSVPVEQSRRRDYNRTGVVYVHTEQYVCTTCMRTTSRSIVPLSKVRNCENIHLALLEKRDAEPETRLREGLRRGNMCYHGGTARLESSLASGCCWRWIYLHITIHPISVHGVGMRSGSCLVMLLLLGQATGRRINYIEEI